MFAVGVEVKRVMAPGFATCSTVKFATCYVVHAFVKGVGNLGCVYVIG